jgi:hypothetical protein
MNEIINKLLYEISTSKNPQILDEDIFDNYSEFLNYRKIINLMIEDYNLIHKSFSICLDITLTKHGTDVINQGGWLKYLENEKKDAEFNKEKSKIELENLKTSTRLNKFLLKTKWLPHIVSIILIAFSIYVYFDDKADSKKLEQRIEVLEKKEK